METERQGEIEKRNTTTEEKTFFFLMTLSDETGRLPCVTRNTHTHKHTLCTYSGRWVKHAYDQSVCAKPP